MKKLLLIFVILCQYVLAVNWADLKSNLVLWYEFEDNEPNTTVLDSSGNGYHGIASINTNQMSTAGKVGKGFAFDGTVYIDCDNSHKTSFQSEFSLICWIKEIVGNTGTYPIAGIADYDLCGHGIYYSVDTGERSVIQVYTACTDYVGQESSYFILPDAGQWIMISMIVSQDGVSTIRLKSYANLELVQERTGLVSFANYDSDLNLYVGARNYLDYLPNSFFEGSLDDFMLFNKALSDEELEIVYKKSKPNGYILIKR
jgi:hypothetical protein